MACRHQLICPAVRARRPEIDYATPGVSSIPQLQLRSALANLFFVLPESHPEESRGTGSQDASLSVLPCHWLPLYHSGPFVNHSIGGLGKPPAI